MELYVSIENIRFQGEIHFQVERDPELSLEEVKLPGLLLQPFVENAIWHGMAGIETAGSIALSIKRKGEQLVWTIEDNGAGRSAKKLEPANIGVKKTSLGTAITRARLDLVQKQHGGKAGLEIFRGKSGPVDLEEILFTKEQESSR